MPTNPNLDSTIIKKLFNYLKLKLTSEPKAEPESAEYTAFRFNLNNKKVIFRRAKITPKKLGLFVTLWQRSLVNQKIEPLDFEDNFDYVIIEALEKNHHGLFIFTKEILANKQIISRNQHDGKRAFRVYPPWSKPISRQAINSQNWQSKYFVFISTLTNSPTDKSLVDFFG